MELVLGTAQWGLAYGIAGPGRAVDAASARDILSAAADAGVRRLDTAQAYGDIEQRLQALLPRGVAWRVTTKIARPPASFDAAAAQRWTREAVERSLLRLGDMIEAVLLHDPATLDDPALAAPVWETLSTICARHGLRAGVSVYAPEELQRLSTRWPIAQAQLPANALDQRIADAATVRAGPIVRHLRSVFLQGLLLLEDAPSRLPAAGAALLRWREWCAANGLAPLEAALAIARGLDPGAAGVVVGTDSLAQFAALAGAWSTSRVWVAPQLRCDDAAVIDPRRWTTIAP